MNEFVERIKPRILFPALLVVLIPLGLYAYLGTFSRYTSDDYCLSAFYYQETGFVTNMIERYQHASSRYTNILFIGFADKVLGWYNPAILPPLMLMVLVIGLYLFVEQIRMAAQLKWNRSVTFYLSALLVYLSLVQTPDLYQTFYWRAGMTSHFAPFAFIPFLGVFVLRQIRLANVRTPSVWVYVVCFLVPFLIGGLSEPPATLMITVLVFAIAAVWWWGEGRSRRSILMILSWTLAGAMTALIVLALAPANGLRVGESTTNVVQLGWKIFSRTFEFIVENIRTLPLPTLASIVIPGLLFYIMGTNPQTTFNQFTQRRLLYLIPIIWLLGYILIASAFAPSVYGQGFPAARARFSGVMLLVAMFMLSGAILGILVANRATSLSRFSMSVLVIFLLFSMYPLRTVSRLAADIPVFQQRAAAWDARDERIRSLRSEGVQDIRVRFLEEDVVQDLGDRSGFRLNRCASSIYGVNSIIALPWEE